MIKTENSLQIRAPAAPIEAQDVQIVVMAPQFAELLGRFFSFLDVKEQSVRT